MDALSDYVYQMLSGPGSFRFFVQPAVAILLGIRDGRLDSHAGQPPILAAVRGGGWAKLAGALRRVVVPLCLATGLSLLFQLIIMRTVHLLPAIGFAVLFVALPYLIARGISQRVDTRWHRTHPKT